MMPVEIHGRSYLTVAERIAEFREKFPDYTLMTEIMSIDEVGVVMKATIADREQHVISTGFAEEVRSSSNINMTSCVENCETSAVGRALSFFGLAGNEIASADEVANAIKQQHEKTIFSQWAEYTQTVEDWHDNLHAIREALHKEQWEFARECWNEIDHDAQRILWRAPTKGGWFTTKERHQMKHFNELINGEVE